MALSPADYAAYSRATGTPYPEDPEERAQITPAVLEFRRNQLRAPQEESNLLGILGAAALGLGALRGGVGIARALTGERAQVPPSSRPPVTPQGEQAVRTASAEGRRRAAEEVTRQARTERPVGVVQTDLSQKNLEDFIRSSPAFGRVPTREPKESAAPGIIRSLPAAAERPDLLAGLTAAPGYAQEFVANRVAEQMASDLIDEVNAFSDPAARSELARQQASVQGQKRKDLWDLVGQIRNESLVSTQETIRPVVSNQALNALESGEDQMTGRMKAQLSRNEDLDMSQVEMLENIAQQNNALMRAQAEPSQMIGYVPDEPINQAAAQLPDGIPIDQAEGPSGALRFLERERMEIASQLGEQGLPVSPSRIETELANRLGKEAYEYGPKYTARRQNLELYAQTGSTALLNQLKRFGLSPVTFETFENMPAAKRTGFENAPPFSTSYYPSEELETLGLSSNIEIDMPGAGRVNLAAVRKPVITESTALAAEDYYQTKKEKALNWLGDLRVTLEPKRNQILKERRLIAEQRANEIMPQLQQAKETGQFDLAQELQTQLQNLRTLWKNPELGTYRQDELRLLNAQISGAQRKIKEDISGIEKRYPTTLRSWSGEADRVFGELDLETGEFIPETMELRSERKMVDLKKGGGGRNVAEFTAGERLDEEIRKIQGGGRMRDYDPETGAPASQYADDRTQTGREIDIYGVRLSSEPKSDPELKPTDVQIPKAGLSNPYSRLDEETLNQMTLMGSPADQYNAAKELSRRKIAGEKISLGGIQSTSEPLVQLPTEAARRSVLMSEAVLKAARQQASRNPRGGILPDEMTQLRMQMAQLQPPAEPVFTRRPPGPRPGAVPPQQLALKGVSGFKARQTKSPADVAAEQLENYMGKLQRGRSTPLTSEAVIQPRLF